jgi:hypothetical protein
MQNTRAWWLYLNMPVRPFPSQQARAAHIEFVHTLSGAYKLNTSSLLALRRAIPKRTFPFNTLTLPVHSHYWEIGTPRNSLAGVQWQRLGNDQRRILRTLADQDGCAEAALFADGFSIDQLAGLVVQGCAVMQRWRVEISGRMRTVVWMRITETGRKAIAGCRAR